MPCIIVVMLSAILLSPLLVGQTSVARNAESAKPIQIGAKVPNISLVDMSSMKTNLMSVLGSKPTVLVFYRGAWCPFCNLQLSELAKIQPEIAAKGYQVIAVSPDLPENLQKMSTADKLTYKLFSDPDAEGMKKFGVAFRVDDDTYTMYKDKYHMDLEKFSGKPHHTLPVPTVYVIDPRGKVKLPRLQGPTKGL